MYTLVFSTIFRATPPKAHNGMTTYVIYLFIALVAWNFFSNVVNGSMAALIGAGPLLKKIYFPPYAPVIGNSVSALVQTFIEAGVLLVVLFGVGNIVVVDVVDASDPVALARVRVGYRSDVRALQRVLPRRQLSRQHRHATAVLLDAGHLGAGSVARQEPWALRDRGTLEEPDVPVRRGVPRRTVGRAPCPVLSRWLWMVASAVVSISVGLFVFNRGSRDVGEEL